MSSIESAASIESKASVNGHWNTKRVLLKAAYPMLTSKELYFEHGKMDAMLESLMVKLGKTKEELLAIINAL